MTPPQAGGLGRAVKRGHAVEITVLVVIALIGGIVAVMLNASYRPASPEANPLGYAAAATATMQPTVAPNCNVTPAAPGCATITTPQATPQLQWITLSDNTPAGVLAAFKQSDAYQMARQPGDGQVDLSRPETPIALHEVTYPPTYDPIEIWVIPFDTANGAIGALANCVASPAGIAVHCGAIEQLGMPRPHGRIAQYTQAQALSMAQAQSHVGLQTGARPYLIYAPIDDAAVATGKWTGGGAWDTPLWLVPGADGQDRVVGDDGKVYLPAQLPLTKSG